MKTKFDIFRNDLESWLQGELPGSEAHRAMESEMRRKQTRLWDEKKARLSAVLLLLYPDQNGHITTVLTLKQNGIGVHSGQISLPGGKFEPEDETLARTALRETEEEIGVSSDKITLIGQLSSITIPRSGFVVYPFVGYCSDKPVFKIQDAEVARLYEVDLFSLLKHSNKDSFLFTEEQGETFTVPSYLLDNRHLWGATAMIMSEIEHILRKEGLLNE